MDRQLVELLDSGGTLITVNSRLARALTGEYNRAQEEAGRTAWPAPEILSLDAWLRRCWNEALDASAFSAGPVRGSASPNRNHGGRVALANETDADLFDLVSTPGAGPPSFPLLLSPQHEQVLWEQIIEEETQERPLLQIGAAARSARQAWGLLRQFRLRPDALVEPLPDDPAAFRQWARHFEELCRRNNWADESALPDLVGDLFRNKTLELRGRIACVGFDNPSPQMAELFDTTGCQTLDLEQAPEPRVARRASFADPAAELDAAARWARGLLESAAREAESEGTPAGLPSIAIVVPDLSDRRAAVERVFADRLHPAAVLPGSAAAPVPLFNISMGLPLAQVPVVRAALLVLELLGYEEPPLETVGAVLRSPFFSGGEAEFTARGAVDAELRREGHLHTTLSRVLCAAQRVGRCRRLLRALSWLDELNRNPGPPFRTPAEWARDFAAVLKGLGWPRGRTPSSAEFQALRRWNGLLEMLASLDGVVAGPPGERSSHTAGRISRHAALARLRQFAAESVFQPETPGDAPVQVLGILEASAGLRFDHLWIVGLHDGTWPPPSHPNPFLPVDLQRRHKMPHCSPEWELTFACRVTAALLGSSCDVVVSWAERHGDEEFRPSPLIASLPELKNTAELPLSPTPLLCDELFAARAVEVVPDTGRIPFRPDELRRLRGGTRIFTDQSACSFRAFARYRLGARGLDPCVAGASAAERGSMVHVALEKVWNRLGTSHALTSLPPPELERITRQAAAEAVREKHPDPGSRIAELEAERLCRLLLEWLGVEAKRRDFTVMRHEHRRRVRFGGLEVEGIIDRIDRLADGQLVVIDYKTGRPEVRHWFGERPDEPQLPIYCASTSSLGGAGENVPTDDDPVHVGAVVFAHVRTGESRFLGIAAPGVEGIPGVQCFNERKEAAPFATWGDLVAFWRAELERLGRQFMGGELKLAPKNPPATCKNCDLGPLCRIHEVASPVAEDGDEEGHSEEDVL